MDSEYATQRRETRDVYGLSQPHPRHPPRPSGRPQYRAQSPDPDCIAQDSQSDEDYIATPEVKKDAWRNRRSRYDDRSTDDSLGNGSPIRPSPPENYSDSSPSDYAPHPKAKSEDRRVKAGWGNSDSFSQPHRLNLREHENYREAKQFLDRFEKLHNHSTDRSDTESYSNDGPRNRQDRFSRQHPDPERDDEDDYAPSPHNYRERHHSERTRWRDSEESYHRFEGDSRRNHREPRARNLDPRYPRPGSYCPDSFSHNASSFSAPPPPPPRHVDHSRHRRGSTYSDNDDHATYSDIASRPSTSHSDRLSRVPTAVDSEDYSAPPPRVPSPPPAIYRRHRDSGSDYAPMPGAFRSVSRSRSRSPYEPVRGGRNRSPYASSPVRGTPIRHQRGNVRYRGDSDDNGVAEGSDYLPSDSEDDERISGDGNGVAEGSDYASSIDGRSDVCEKDSWGARVAGVERVGTGGRAYGKMW